MFRSQYADVPAVEEPIHEAVLGRAAERGDTPARVDGVDGTTLTPRSQVMKGYLGHPDATAAMIDPDGWLHTGDVGHVDADGWLFVVDRVKELINAYVVRQPSATGSSDLSEGDIMMYVAERVAPYKRVRGVTFIEGVPRAASGKILRRDLRARR